MAIYCATRLQKFLEYILAFIMRTLAANNLTISVINLPGQQCTLLAAVRLTELEQNKTGERPKQVCRL
jgi:uncharacterized paraquat-inducible protein A